MIYNIFFAFFQEYSLVSKSEKRVDFSKNNDIMNLVHKKGNAEWCNGSTADSDSVSRGSNPFSVVFLCDAYYRYKIE